MGLLSKENVLQIHSSILKKFGGGEGILNIGMLDSALNSGLATFDNQELFPSLIEKIVRISHGIISNHAFVDGNKRVGIAYLIISMRENNIQISISHKDLIGIGYAVGAGQMSYEEMLFKVKNQNENFKLHLNESLFEEYNGKIIYKSVSNIDKFKKYADEILGGYGGMSDSDIKRDIEEIYIDGELKGYLGLSKYNEEDGTKLLGIGNFMILERGKGYGTQVINDLVSKYKNEYDLIYCFVDSDNEGAISLYKKLGKVYDEDGPNDNGQYYVTFYDNGKYKLEESFRNRDINDIETPEQLMDWMESNITYELANDEYGAEDDPPTKTAEEVIETGTGHCAEQSYLEYKVLDELGYFPQLIFVKENNSKKDYGADGSAHMFVVYQDDDDKYTYFEHSQEHNKGIHKFDSMSELLDFVGKNWWRYDANSDILEVRYIDEPITGVNNWELAKECHKYPVDEVLDISNNVMEDEVPQDAKWDYNKHGIVGKDLTEASFKHSYKNSFGQANQYRGFIVVESKNSIDIYDGSVHDQNLVESNFKSLDDAKLYVDLITGYAKKPFSVDYKYSIILLLSAGLDEKLKSMIEDGIKLRNISKKGDDLDFYIQIGSTKDNLNDIIKKYNLQNYVVNFRKKSAYSGPQSSHSIEDLLRLGYASRRGDAIAYSDNLTEAKKRKNKRKNQTQNDPVFKNIDDMKKWVKKRQKGMGYFVHMDCGNMDYNNDMFNKMHGLGDTSSSSTTDDGASDAAPSGGDVGVGMGESLEMNKDAIKLSPNLMQFIKEHKDLINEKDWDTLFLDYAEDELSEEDQSQLVQALISIGCDIEVMD